MIHKEAVGISSDFLALFLQEGEARKRESHVGNSQKHITACVWRSWFSAEEHLRETLDSTEAGEEIRDRIWRVFVL